MQEALAGEDRGAAQRALFVTDFDGTLTTNDFYRVVVECFAPEGLAEHWAGYQSGRLTHFQALRLIFAAIRASEADMLAAVERTNPDPDLAVCVRALHAAGWDVVVASAGCEWYIGRVLARCGVNLPIYANPGTFSPEAGLLMEAPTESPFFCPATGIDKAAIVRQGIDQGRLVAFAGDGFPDLPAALLVDPEFRFARADLALALDRQGASYRPFGRWAEVARMLLARPGG
jgi:2,3-diketo-5-methylthio-1-phosphopentane phosphatase